MICKHIIYKEKNKSKKRFAFCNKRNIFIHDIYNCKIAKCNE